MTEQEIDPMAAQFAAMLKSMPDEALSQIHTFIEDEMETRGLFAEADEAD